VGGEGPDLGKKKMLKERIVRGEYAVVGETGVGGSCYRMEGKHVTLFETADRVKLAKKRGLPQCPWREDRTAVVIS